MVSPPQWSGVKITCPSVSYAVRQANQVPEPRPSWVAFNAASTRRCVFHAHIPLTVISQLRVVEQRTVLNPAPIRVSCLADWNTSIPCLFLSLFEPQNLSNSTPPFFALERSIRDQRAAAPFPVLHVPLLLFTATRKSLDFQGNSWRSIAQGFLCHHR